MPDPTRSAIRSSASVWYSFITLKGNFQFLAQEVETLELPGTDGSAFRETGRRGKPFEMIGTVDVLDDSTLTTLHSSLTDLQGTMCAIIDDFGIATRENSQIANTAMCLEAERVAAKPTAVKAGGLVASATRLFTMRFLFKFQR